MFARARRRLTLAYIAVFALVFGLFTAVFFVALAIVLQPDFDVDPNATSDTSEEQAYQAAIDRIGVALLVADGVAVVAVGVAAWLLADRTLGPIRDAHERQRRFVADASHELRTPVAAIRAGTEAALGADTPPDGLRATLRNVVSSTERLTRITNDLLVLARTDDQTIQRRHESFDLSVVVAEAIETERAAIGRRPAEVRLAPDLVVDADADEVGQIVRNLVENAFVHGGDGVRVRVATTGSDREAVVEVEDDGLGIPAGERAHVFEPFYRSRRDAAAPSGSGLGLAIAADLAQRNGGRLTVDGGRATGVVARLTLPRFR